MPSVSDEIAITIPGRAEPIEANRYVVAKGDQKSLVLYWYQSRDRVVASEYKAKFYVVADALRYNRTDTALVRVVVPIIDGDVEKIAEGCCRFCAVLLRAFASAFSGVESGWQSKNFLTSPFHRSVAAERWKRRCIPPCKKC